LSNRIEIAGRLIEMGALRHTPAGMPVLEFRLRHESQRIEAGTPRAVEVEIDAIAFDGQARLLAGAAAGSALKTEGFLCSKSLRSRKPVLHITSFEFIEGA